jgi:hypothetical protein
MVSNFQYRSINFEKLQKVAMQLTILGFFLRLWSYGDLKYFLFKNILKLNFLF